MKSPLLLLLLLAAGVAAGCSGGAPKARPGSPAFIWSVARESYRTGDVLKAEATLLELSRTDNSFSSPARVCQIVVSAGVAQGFSDLAAAYEMGGQRNPDKQLQFRNQAANLRSFAATAALEFTQAFHDVVDTNKDANVQCAFGLPPGSTVPPEALLKISAGLWAREADREMAQSAMLQRGVLRAVLAAVGAPDDPARKCRPVP